MAKKESNGQDDVFKASDVLNILRQDLIEGRLKPGDRFPTRLELRAKYNLAAETVQKIFDALIGDGFAMPRGMAGTFVSANPPHLSNFGVIFAGHPNHGDWRRFDGSLLNEALSLDNGSTRRLRHYRGIQFPSDFPDFKQLIEDCRARRVGGLIFTSRPEPETINQILTSAPGMPCVAIMERPELAHVTPLALGGEYITKGLDYFLSRGRRRVAFLNAWVHGELVQVFEHYLLEEAKLREMTVKPRWTLQIHLNASPTAQNIMQLLFANPNDRPDALFITDDNLVEQAALGLLAAGVRVPEDVEVIAHANFPWTTPCAVRAKRLGYDSREILERAMEAITLLQRQERNFSALTVSARLEDEIPRLQPR